MFCFAVLFSFIFVSLPAPGGMKTLLKFNNITVSTVMYLVDLVRTVVQYARLAIRCLLT